MVEVCGRQAQTPWWRERLQDGEEGHRVGTAGDSHEDVLPVLCQSVALDYRRYLADEGSRTHNHEAGSAMGAFSRGQCLFLVLTCLLGPPSVSAEPRPGTGQGGLPGDASIPPEILALLSETRDTYGPDAVVLQVQLLHHAIHAGSILPAGVRVTGFETKERQGYVVFAVETGIVFSTDRVSRRGRVGHLWSSVLMPALSRLGTYELPGDGIATEFAYFHRSYDSTTELQETVQDDPGRIDRTTFYIRHSDILAFRRRELDAAGLYSRIHARVDGVPFTEALPP
jgi:hypothetical protein